MQSNQLAIVRAALTFWDEEMASSSKSIYQHYLHSNDREAVITAEDVAETRIYFNQVIPKFGLMDLQTGRLVSKKLVDDSRELTCGDKQQIVSVLFADIS